MFTTISTGSTCSGGKSRTTFGAPRSQHHKKSTTITKEVGDGDNENPISKAFDGERIQRELKEFYRYTSSSSSEARNIYKVYTLYDNHNYSSMYGNVNDDNDTNADDDSYGYTRYDARQQQQRHEKAIKHNGRYRREAKGVGSIGGGGLRTAADDRISRATTILFKVPSISSSSISMTSTPTSLSSTSPSHPAESNHIDTTHHRPEKKMSSPKHPHAQIERKCILARGPRRRSSFRIPDQDYSSWIKSTRTMATATTSASSMTHYDPYLDIQNKKEEEFETNSFCWSNAHHLDGTYRKRNHHHSLLEVVSISELKAKKRLIEERLAHGQYRRKCAIGTTMGVYVRPATANM